MKSPLAVTLGRLCLRTVPFVVTAGALLYAGGWAMGLIGSYLVVEDPLQKASAIVVLAGGTPEREAEGASVYNAGWAPRIVLVGGVLDERRAILETHGVPRAAILVVQDTAGDTLAELQLARSLIGSREEPVIFVTSSYHTRRVKEAWAQIGADSQASVLRPVQNDTFEPRGWWTSGQVGTVIHEYMGLIALGAHARA
jgi:uncharacterized SAM-binding protein YcdF (DUF218 family)